MAVMHPSGLTKINFGVDSEEYVYNILKESLPDKIHVFYSVRWNQELNDSIYMGEGDFVIVDPDFGFLVLEVKGGYKIVHDHDEWILWNNLREYRKLHCSPYEQANKSLWTFVDKYNEKYHENLKATFGYAVCFPYFNVPSDLCCDMTEGNTIMLKDMDNLKNKINLIFHSWRRPNAWLSKETFERLISLFEGEAYEKTSIYAVCRMNLRELQAISNLQDSCIDMLYHYNQALVIGSAGTGKTMMAIRKAKLYAESGKKVLFVCFNKLACQAAQLKLKDNNVECHTFHSLIHALLGAEKYNRLIDRGLDLHGILDMLETYVHIRYDSIVVDEAQDFMEEWAMATRFLLKDDKNSDLYVFYDEEQNIFHRDFGEAFLIPLPPFVLRRNLRNTKNIWEWVSQDTKLGIDSLANEVQGLSPNVYISKNEVLAINEIQKRIIQATSEKIQPSSIVILSDRKKENSILSTVNELGGYKIVENKDLAKDLKKEIAFYTIQSYKGLESDIVICLLAKDTDVTLRYVAYSRAKSLLYIVQY